MLPNIFYFCPFKSSRSTDVRTFCLPLNNGGAPYFSISALCGSANINPYPLKVKIGRIISSKLSALMLEIS
jgi:hypothetical protein